MDIRFSHITGRISEIVEAVMASVDVPAESGQSNRIRLCVEEVVSNVVNYAYGGADGWLEVSTALEACFLVLTFKDGGRPFNPLGQPDPDLSLPLSERNAGGLGIYLCKQFSESMGYIRKDECNLLEIKITK